MRAAAALLEPVRDAWAANARAAATAASPLTAANFNEVNAPVPAL
jgi:hypothetical protein